MAGVRNLGGEGGGVKELHDGKKGLGVYWEERPTQTHEA